MTKILMTGANGRIGKELREYGVLPLSGDVTDPLSLLDTVLQEKPDIIVHMASISDVEYCERPENWERVITTNLTGTANVLNVAEEVGAKVVLLSTDHVFGGGVNKTRKGPYKETDTPTPINSYGLSKFAAEALQEAYDNLYVVRTSYLFDKKRLGLVYPENVIEIQQPDFIYRSFMYIPHFVSNLYMYLSNVGRMPKLIHIAGSTTISWYGFWKTLFPNVQPRKKKLDMFAPRPYVAGLRTNYKLLPTYSFLDGINAMMGDRK